MTLRVLLVVHGIPPAACGGTETYTADLAQALARQPGVEVTMLVREGDPLRPELDIRRERRGDVEVILVNNTFQACETFHETYSNPSLRRAVAPVLDDIRPDVAHVQHLTCLSTELLEEFASRHIPIVVTLNDYWLMCHRGQLIDDAGRRCDGPGERGCGSCIPAAALVPHHAWRTARRLRRVPGLGAAAAVAERLVDAVPRPGRRRAASAARADHVRAMCSHVDLFLAPSRTLRDRYVAFGIPAERIESIAQGIDVAPFRAPRAPRTPDGPLRVAFVGSLMSSKGPDVLLRAVELLPPGSVSLDVIGGEAAYHGSHEYSRNLRPRLAAAPISTLGPLPHDRLGEYFARTDVLVVPSIWIENAPFVIREAFAARVPVIASRVGGMAEMIRDGVDGFLFAPGDASALAGQLRRVVDEPAILERLRSNIRSVMTIDEDAAQLVTLYLCAAPRDNPAPCRQSRRVSQRLTAVILNYRTPEQTWMAARSLQSSTRPPDDLVVVDNGSGDGSEGWLRERCAGARVLQAGANLGFSGGCNVGIRQALADGADAVLLVNSDVTLAPDAIALLDGALEWYGSAGIAGPVVMSRAEPDLIASAGMVFRPASGRMRHRGAGLPLSWLAPGVRVVGAISGCAMLVKRDVFDRVGLLDEEYFFSYEDLDFCLRAERVGVQTICVPGAVAYHEGGASIGRRSARRVYYGVRNHLRVAERLFPLPMLATAGRRAAILTFSAAYVTFSPDVPLLSGLALLGRGVVDHARGRYGPART